MVFGILHKGSGMGDQLFRYLTVRSLANERGVRWGMAHHENFKGASFMKPDLGINLVDGQMKKIWSEKDVRQDGVDIRSYDPDINFLPDDVVIDGNFEDLRYWMHNLNKFDEWLPVAPLAIPDTTCVIGFRGGEYATVPELFLPKEYWDKGIARMKELGITNFEVHTDDEVLAAKFFPEYKCVHDIGINWRSIRFAKHALIANSAFYIIPRLIAHQSDPRAITLAPRFWARHNKQVWARPSCFYPQFTYFHATDSF